jgi:GT2 family glycosyltransferase
VRQVIAEVSTVNEPLVVVVILTHNQKEHTLQCLRSFRDIEYSNVQLILVDNGSNDGTEEAVKAEFQSVHFVKSSENKGAAGGRNLGIKYANSNFDYDYLLTIDNDTIVEKNFLRPLVEALEAHPEAGLASPKLHLIGQKDVIDSAGGSNVNFYTGSTLARGHGQKDYGQYDDCETPSCIPSGIVLIRPEVIRQCAGFDEAFDPYGAEDLDFAFRAKAAGFSFRFVPGSLVHHKGTKTGFYDYTPAYAVIKGRNLKLFVKRHSTICQRICFHILLPFLGVRTLIREILNGNPLAPLYFVRGFLGKNK